MSQFQKGDVVQLVSGGPKMSVADVGNYGPLGPELGVKCVWFFDIKGVPKVDEKVFDEAVLKPYEPPRTSIPLRRA